MPGVRSLAAVIAIISVAVPARGQIVSAEVDILDGVDPGAPSPAGVTILDFRVDVAETDTWATGGIRCVTDNGASIIYADSDFNTPGVDLINTGSTNNRFVTVLSQPRMRNGAGRFDNGAVAITGSHDPPSSVVVTHATELNVSFVADPPPDSASPSVDGYVVRIALSTPGADPNVPGSIFVSTNRHDPIGRFIFASIEAAPGSSGSGWVNSTFDVETPAGSTFYLWRAIPEPGSLALILLAAPFLRRRVAR